MTSAVMILRLARQDDGRVHVMTITSPSGEPEGTFEPPYSGPYQSQAIALALEAVKFEGPRWEKVPDMFNALKDLQLSDEHDFKADLPKRVGRTLYEALFPLGGMREALHATLNAASDAEPARVELRFHANATALGAYPWELLYDDTRGFLFAGRRAALIRYVTCELPPPELLTADKLNLLLITSRPVDPLLQPLLDDERRAIEEGLAEPRRAGHVKVEHLPPASPNKSTWKLLNDHLVTHKGEHAPHVFHFDGHGGFGRRCPRPKEVCGELNPADATECRACGHRLGGESQGYLAFEREDKRPDWISAQELGTLFAGVGVRLAVLTACKSAVVAGESVFGGMGLALIQAGVPAVVAMQFSVTAPAAMQFARLFYLSLGQRDPLTLAVGQARALLFGNHRTAWYRPVLYLRTDKDNPEGRLFTVPPESKETVMPGADTFEIEPKPSKLAPVSVQQKMKLVDALLACPTMSNRDTRDAVVDELPSDIRSNIRRNPVDRVDVANIVTRCLDFPDGIGKLIELVRFYEGPSIHMQRLDELMR